MLRSDVGRELILRPDLSDWRDHYLYSPSWREDYGTYVLHHVRGRTYEVSLPDSLLAFQQYNLRASNTYATSRTVWTKTSPATVGIALREAPDPRGEPGRLRVDTVHQGDRNGAKGLYLVNIVDEVTQFEWVGAVEGISERFLGDCKELRVKGISNVN